MHDYKLPNFIIRVAKPAKTVKNNSYTKVSRKVLAVVYKNDSNEWEAHVKLNNGLDEVGCYPLTPESLNLRNKTHVFSHNVDKYGNLICFIRDQNKCNIWPGSPKQYCVMAEGILISGYIVKTKNKLYFDYEQLVAFNSSSPHLNPVKIDATLPVFKQ